MSVIPRKNPRHILELSREEKREFLDSFDHVISDIDGVIWNLMQNIDGSADGIQALKNAGKKVTFLSNNSVRSTEMCIDSFRKNNMQVDRCDILHPAIITVEYLKSIQFEGLIYFIGCENFKKVLTDAHFQILDGPTKIFNESMREFLGGVFDKEPVRAVIMDVDFNLNYAKLMKALQYLKHPDCMLIFGATDMKLSITKDVNVIGPGVFSRIIEEMSKKEIMVMGKPSKELGHMVKKYYNIEHSNRVLMIGDMLEQDILFGNRSGFQTLAVLSGGCSLEDIKKMNDIEFIPDYYATSLKDFIEFMNVIHKSNV